MSASTITLFTTGGTLDKDYQATSGELVFDESHLPQMLQQANCTLAIEHQPLMQKDSLEMTDADRKVILEACLQSNAQHIVITHGTDTMTDTANLLLAEQQKANDAVDLDDIIEGIIDTVVEVLFDESSDSDTKTTGFASKTIVLTGAMRPFQLGKSDALFNLGSAMMAAQLAPAGIYIAMNGNLLDAANVVKNRTKGVFETEA